MSLHSDQTICRQVDRATMWVARCECGFEGSEHPAQDHHKAHTDYREHVEAALGAGAYYDAGVGCRNCGSEHVQGILIGTHASSEACTQCGTRMLQPRNSTWDESRQARKWFT